MGQSVMRVRVSIFTILAFSSFLLLFTLFYIPFLRILSLGLSFQGLLAVLRIHTIEGLSPSRLGKLFYLQS